MHLPITAFISEDKCFKPRWWVKEVDLHNDLEKKFLCLITSRGDELLCKFSRSPSFRETCLHAVHKGVHPLANSMSDVNLDMHTDVAVLAFV